MSDSFKNLNDLLKNVVLNTPNAAAEASSSNSSIKLPSLPPNIVPLTEQDLRAFLYQSQPQATKTNDVESIARGASQPQHQQQVSSSLSSTSLSQLPLPSIDIASKDLQQQMQKFEQLQQTQQFNANNSQPLSQMQQLQKLQQLHQLEQLQKLQYMSQQNSFLNDLQSSSLPININSQSASSSSQIMTNYHSQNWVIENFRKHHLNEPKLATILEKIHVNACQNNQKWL